MFFLTTWKTVTQAK